MTTINIDLLTSGLTNLLVRTRMPIMRELDEISDADLTNKAYLPGVPRPLQVALILACGLTAPDSHEGLTLNGAISELQEAFDMEDGWPADDQSALVCLQSHLSKLARTRLAMVHEGDFFWATAAAFPSPQFPFDLRLSE